MIVFVTVFALLGTSCSAEPGTLLLLPEPRSILAHVDFLPILVKGNRPEFPRDRILVLEPRDARKSYPLKSAAPFHPTKGNAAVLGIYGQNSQEGRVQVNSLPLGAQQKMRAGISSPPDVPIGIFLLPDFPRLVQNTLARHFTAPGFTVAKDPGQPAEISASTEKGPVYFAESEIKTFSLIAPGLYREVEVNANVSCHTITVPLRRPFRAVLTLGSRPSHWPEAPAQRQG